MLDLDLIFLLPILELLVRGTVTFLALTLVLRIVGQREAGGMVSVIPQAGEQTVDDGPSPPPVGQQWAEGKDPRQPSTHACGT